jgi:hypothetical protein
MLKSNYLKGKSHPNPFSNSAFQIKAWYGLEFFSKKGYLLYMIIFIYVPTLMSEPQIHTLVYPTNEKSRSRLALPSQP